MASLEQRVRELTGRAVAREPAVLQSAVNGERLRGSQSEVNQLVIAALGGIYDALIEIAREIDERGLGDDQDDLGD
jgi:hypothetical protein